MNRSQPRAPGSRHRRLDVGAADAADLAAWTALADRAVEPNPFFRPEFLRANVLGRGVRSELLVVLDGERWIACLPVRNRRPSRNLPLPHLESATDAYVLLGTPLIDRDAVGAAVDGLLDIVRAERHAAALMLSVFPVDGPIGSALSMAAATRGVRPIVHGAYRRAGWRRSPDGTPRLARFQRSGRKELARRGRLLMAELGGELTVVDRTDDPAAWDEFLEMENSGWKADHGTALGSTPEDASFFRHMCAAMAAIGKLEVVSLEAGGTSVAMEVHLIDGDALFSFKIAHAVAYRRGSPGTQLKARVIDGLSTRGLALADSCASPLNVHMNRLWPDQRAMQTLLLPTTARSSALVRPAETGKTVARHLRDDVLRRGRTKVA